MNPADPTGAEFGVIEESVGAGFGATLIVNAFEVEGLGLLTVTESVPSDARSAAGIVAKIKVEFRKLTVMSEPFIWTVEEEMKPEP